MHRLTSLPPLPVLALATFIVNVPFILFCSLSTTVLSCTYPHSQILSLPISPKSDFTSQLYIMGGGDGFRSVVYFVNWYVPLTSFCFTPAILLCNVEEHHH